MLTFVLCHVDKFESHFGSIYGSLDHILRSSYKCIHCSVRWSSRFHAEQRTSFGCFDGCSYGIYNLQVMEGIRIIDTMKKNQTL